MPEENHGAGARECACGYAGAAWRVAVFGRAGADGLYRSSDAIYVPRCPRCGRLLGERPVDREELGVEPGKKA